MERDESVRAGVSQPRVESRRQVTVGARAFDVRVGTAADGRAELVVECRDVDGAVRSEVRGWMSPGDVAAFARVLSAELKSMAAWYGLPAGNYADVVAEARRAHVNAYTPWSAVEVRRLVARFRAGVGLPELAREFGRSPGAIRGRLEQEGEIEPVRAARS